jgi:hypothetical protein
MLCGGVLWILYRGMYFLLDHPRRDLAARVETELVEDIDDVPLRGRGGDDQFVADLAVGEAVRDQLRDFTLARCEAAGSGQAPPAGSRPTG